MSNSKRVFEELINTFGYTSRLVSQVNENGSDFYVDGEAFTISLVDSDEGDGDGAAIWFVYKISKNDRTEPEFLCRITGTRSSWSDNYYDDELEVVHGKPVQVTQYYKAA